MRRLIAFAACGIAVVAAAVLTPQRAFAMPPFAQAYGIPCSVCHTQVPALNTYGRYVQRTGYGSLDPHVLKRALPVWIGEQANYDTASGTYQIQVGNLAVHAVGPIGDDVTYHFQQWIYQDNGAGGLDSLWFAYNNLLHRDGHLFAGLIEAPAPSPFSQWMDLSAFAVPEMTVGEHAYALDANRWGAKFNYVKNNFTVEAGWMYNDNSWSGSSAFINTDKTFQYRAAYANPSQPLEAGIFGSRGSVPLEEGGYDQYWSETAYVQRDPWKGVPGVFAQYQIALDGNPAFNLGSAGSNGSTIELYQPIFDKGVISIRKEWTNDGLGTLNQSGNLDLNYQIAKYLHFYVEESWASHTTPQFRYTLWWTTPVSVVK